MEINNNTETTISIIIPVYNTAKYLKKCIKSICVQDYMNIEIILIDDGSVDGSELICDEFSKIDQRIKVIHQSNGGGSKARNAGIEIATGDYITFIDSDDWIERDHISSLLRFQKDEKHFVYGNVIRENAKTGDKRVMFNYRDGVKVNPIKDDFNEFEKKFKILLNGLTVGKLFHRETLLKKNLKFETSLSWNEDHIFVLNYLYYIEHIIISERPTYHYMQYGNVSLSNRRNPVEKMIYASNNLISILDLLTNRFKLTDLSCLKEAYTYLGLNQLIIPCTYIEKNNYKLLGNAIRNRYKLFQKYYSPTHKILKVIPVICLLHLEKILLWIIRLRD